MTSVQLFCKQSNRRVSHTITCSLGRGNYTSNKPNAFVTTTLWWRSWMEDQSQSGSVSVTDHSWKCRLIKYTQFSLCLRVQGLPMWLPGESGLERIEMIFSRKLLLTSEIFICYWENKAVKRIKQLPTSACPDRWRQSSRLQTNCGVTFPGSSLWCLLR